MKKIEIACFNLESALIAQKAGVDRVELCADISVGGTTPTIEMIQQAHENLTIDLYIMIRPRGGNFVYSDSEFAFSLDKSRASTYISRRSIPVSSPANVVFLELPSPSPATNATFFKFCML